MATDKPLYVTQPTLPPLEEFIPYLEQIWQSKVLTNAGPFHQKFEQALCDYLGVEYVSLFNNGTIALMTALQALRIKGEVITTPYSFVATAHSLLWNSITPVFVDIDPVNLNLDPDKIESVVTPRTTAIMPVHCYGHPCEVDRIKKIADKHGLKVIYDAAHAFGVKHDDRSVLRYGDLSVLSFHATKVFNTFEGGAIVSPDAETKQHIDRLKNFGFAGENAVVELGINGKMSEFNAALGLLQIKGFDDALQKRKAVDALYRARLAGTRGIRVLSTDEEKVSNHSYFPIMVEPEYLLSRDALYQKLKDNGIHARRYFYPLISDFPIYQKQHATRAANLPNAQAAASRILCLPMSSNLSDDDVKRVATCIRSGADCA